MAKSRTSDKQHEGKGGRKFQGDTEANKGHDLLNTESSTAGVTAPVESPSDAKNRAADDSDLGEGTSGSGIGTNEIEK